MINVSNPPYCLFSGCTKLRNTCPPPRHTYIFMIFHTFSTVLIGKDEDWNVYCGAVYNFWECNISLYSKVSCRQHLFFVANGYKVLTEYPAVNFICIVDKCVDMTQWKLQIAVRYAFFLSNGPFPWDAFFIVQRTISMDAFFVQRTISVRYVFYYPTDHFREMRFLSNGPLLDEELLFKKILINFTCTLRKLG